MNSPHLQDLFGGVVPLEEQPAVEPVEVDPVDLSKASIEELSGGLLARGLKLYDLAIHVANTERTPRSIEVTSKVLEALLKAAGDIRKETASPEEPTVQSEDGIVYKGTLTELMEAMRGQK